MGPPQPPRPILIAFSVPPPPESLSALGHERLCHELRHTPGRESHLRAGMEALPEEIPDPRVGLEPLEHDLLEGRAGRAELLAPPPLHQLP